MATTAADSLATITASFNTAAATYECRVGNATRTVAAALVALTPPLGPAPVVLDSACGTGAVTAEVLNVHPGATVHAVDGAAGMVELLEGQVESAPGWKGRVKTAVMDGGALGFGEGVFDASYTNFGIFFYPEPAQGAREIYRTLKVGGTALVTCWKVLPLVDVLFKVQKVIAPATPIDSLPVVAKWKDPAVLEGTMREGGFEKVQIVERDTLLVGKTLRELSTSFAENMKSFAGDSWSAEEKGRALDAVIGYFEGDGKELLVQREPEGLGVKMVAWVAVCTK